MIASIFRFAGRHGLKLSAVDPIMRDLDRKEQRAKNKHRKSSPYAKAKYARMHNLLRGA